jgi:hypothetical protein
MGPTGAPPMTLSRGALPPTPPHSFGAVAICIRLLPPTALSEPASTIILANHRLCPCRGKMT